MSWFQDKKLKTKLLLAFAAVLALTGFLGVFALHELSAVGDTAADLGGNTLLGTREIDQIAVILNTYRRHELRLLLVALLNPADVAARTQADQQAEADLESLKKAELVYEPLIDSPDEKKIYDDYVQKRTAYLNQSHNFRSLILAGKDKEAVALMDSSLKLFTDAADEIAVDVEFQKKQSDEAVSNSEKTRSSGRFWILCVLGASGLVSLSLAFWIARLIAQPVQEVVDVAKRIAAGDLTSADIANRSADEIGELAAAINAMKNSLRDTIASVSTGAERIAAASEEFSATAAEQAQGAETQKDQTHQVAAAMQEMSSTVQQVSENSSRAADASRKAADAAREGGTIVEDTLGKMRAIANSVEETAQKVRELGKSSAQIGQIIGVIDDIADQTNLLALNAAIEAARAGEQGRGFAVVADEVRKLAERTSKATKEITQMIQSIQTETQSAVVAMQAGTQQVELGVKSTAQAGTSLKEIIKTSEQVGDMVVQIAAAAKEQASATEEINANIEQISKITQESANGATEGARAVHELSNLATDLQSLVGRFQVGANGNRTRQQKKRAPRELNSLVDRDQPDYETVSTM